MCFLLFLALFPSLSLSLPLSLSLSLPFPTAKPTRLHNTETLDPRYADQYPLVNKKLNIPFILHEHINHPENCDVSTHLRTAALAVGMSGYRYASVFFSFSFLFGCVGDSRELGILVCRASEREIERMGVRARERKRHRQRGREGGRERGLETVIRKRMDWCVILSAKR